MSCANIVFWKSLINPLYNHCLNGVRIFIYLDLPLRDMICDHGYSFSLN